MQKVKPKQQVKKSEIEIERKKSKKVTKLNLKIVGKAKPK